MQKLKKTRRKHKQNRKKQNNKHKNSKENTKTRKYRISSPRTSANKSHKLFSQTLRDIYFSRRFVGWKSCISVSFYVFLRVFMFLLFFFLFLFLYMFSPSLFKLLHLQSTNTHINHIKQTEQLEGTHKTKHKTKQKSPSQTLRDIYFSRRFVGWKSCFLF